MAYVLKDCGIHFGPVPGPCAKCRFGTSRDKKEFCDAQYDVPWTAISNPVVIVRPTIEPKIEIKMNHRHLEQIGVPAECFKYIGLCIADAVKKGRVKGKAKVAKLVEEIVEAPEKFVDDQHFAPFAKSLIEARSYIKPGPVPYKTWGHDGIDENCHTQMTQACSIPVARAAALMPDAHLGYGLPIGGVLACENAVVPYAVGVDIACRMKVSIIDMPVIDLSKRFNLFKESLEGGTRFGVGAEWQRPKNHAVLDQDWEVTRITRENKDKAVRQLGTSGSGNHFAEFGMLTLQENNPFNLKAGSYIALMTHSGSRGPGAAVCDAYSRLAQKMLSPRYEEFGRLAWLDLDTQEGQEYWAAMNLMGDFAAANHDVIHRSVTKLLGAEIIGGVENHHNFAFKEIHDGKELIVHRKGATPAGEGVVGVVPGSMGSPAFIVKGKGNPDSLCSASHGAGRVMSRKAAKEKFSWNATKKNLEKQGIVVLSAGADEVPGVYKDIEAVMAAQEDLVEIVGRFDPRIVKMSDDGKSED